MNQSELVDKIIAEVSGVISKAKTVKKLDKASIGYLADVIQETIKQVEVVSSEVKKLSSKQKLQLAIDVLNKIVDIPYVPEFMEERILSIMISVAVEWMNKRFGKNWLQESN